MLSRIALSMMKGATPGLVRRMAETGISPEELFSLPAPELSDRLGLRGERRLQDHARDEAMGRARREYDFVNAHGIRTASLCDDDYPLPLGETERAPLILYRLGECPLEAPHMLSVVGTRRCTAYGTGFVRKAIADLAAYFPDLVIVSGLAYGIDKVAHEAALEHGLRTIAVLAHGLDRVYPAPHRDLAARIVRSGGALVSEYPSGTSPLRGNFLERNRIVALLPAGTLVAESDIKGGSMSTAATAHSYSREVMALPGRAGDAQSAGCNHLIRTHRASLVTSAADIMEVLGWQPDSLKIDLSNRNLFPELDGDTRRLHEFLRFRAAPVPFAEILKYLGLPVHALTSLLGDMEFEGLVTRHPGNRFSAEC